MTAEKRVKSLEPDDEFGYSKYDCRSKDTDNSRLLSGSLNCQIQHIHHLSPLISVCATSFHSGMVFPIYIYRRTPTGQARRSVLSCRVSRACQGTA
jgi:hypothetical protein